uniref:Glycosyltransferase n=1 Tax=Pyramimonas orientalis virus TaxID=455367 RepID=A0A7M3UNY3_POV01|nr:hypothetical protein HWQ62_00292 [Pyramimonas orientalis virus]
MVVLNIYIIHYTKRSDRLGNIEKLRTLAKEEPNLQININVVDDHQPESININNIKNLVKLEALPEGENIFYQKFLKQMSLPIFSNTFHHFKAIQHISKNSPNEYNIILEDDVVYSNKIFTQISTLIDTVKTTDFDIIFLGQPSDKTPTTNNLQVDNMDTKDIILHCCESYMVSSKAAKDILINFFPIRFVYNIQMSYIINKHNYKCMKIFPNICGDGSKMGDFTSSILTNNVLIFNEVYKKVYIMLESGEPLTDAQQNEITDLFLSNQRKNNPDFMYLEALFHKKLGNIKTSKTMFEQAMALYEKDDVPMNNTSTFLKNYIEMFRVIQ